MMLCDFAETINGKLYVHGGGWSQVTTGGAPVTMFLAAKLLVPWTQTNRRNGIALELFTADGDAVVGPDGLPVRLLGDFEVGRPPGLPPGTDIDFPLSYRLEGLPLPVGRYRWELRVDGVLVTSVTFDVL